MNTPARLEELLDVPPPPGRSRESNIRLSSAGQFIQDGDRFAHQGLSAAMHTWITRHPRDGRYILYNGYDWSYFTVEDAPYVVMHLAISPGSVRMHLSDGSEEPLSAQNSYHLGNDDALYVNVKAGAPGGPYPAKFTRHAQTSLEPYLRVGDGGIMSISLPDGEVVIGPKPSFG